MTHSELKGLIWLFHETELCLSMTHRVCKFLLQKSACVNEIIAWYHVTTRWAFVVTWARVERIHQLGGVI